MNTALETLHDVVRGRRLLIASTRAELSKRYAGAALGLLWTFLNPLLFLSVYLFLYVVVFKVRLPEMNTLRFATFVFGGLVPFLSVMEVANGSVPVIRANISLVKNLIFPVTMIPLRTVLIGLITQFVGLAMLLLLAAIDGDLSWKIVLLPLVIVLQFLFLSGIAFLCAGFGMMLPDFGYFLSNFLLFILFITPIGFKPDMVPNGLTALVTLNPFAYMVGAYRSVIFASYPLDPTGIAIFGVIALIVFSLGAAFFRKFRAHVVDYE